jgi:hypothetical protein
MLDYMCLGSFKYEVMVTLRNALLINSMLANAAVWYGVNKADLEQLEKVDSSLLAGCLAATHTTPRVMIYLSLGCIPVRFILQSRRILFLHYILSQDKESMIYKFFMAMVADPKKGDWWLSTKHDLESLNLSYNFSQIQSFTKTQFKKIVSDAITMAAFNYLNSEKLKLSKIKHIKFDSLKMQPYLLPQSKLTQIESQFMFHAKSRMLNVAVNYPGTQGFKGCAICRAPNSQDDQRNLLSCPQLVPNQTLVEDNVTYDDLFSDDYTKQVRVMRIMMTNYNRRNQILKLRNEQKKNTTSKQVANRE